MFEVRFSFIQLSLTNPIHNTKQQQTKTEPNQKASDRPACRTLTEQTEKCLRNFLDFKVVHRNNNIPRQQQQELHRRGKSITRTVKEKLCVVYKTRTVTTSE